jgi:transcriptional regulator with XRE-family HTH domain
MVAKLTVRYPDFGKRVQQRAKEKGLSIAEIQKALKVTYEMARRYWKGIAKPRSHRMKILASLLSSSVAWLEYGEKESDSSSARERATISYAQSTQLALSDEAVEIGMVFQMLSPAQREFYRSQMFRDAALKRVAPWLRTGRPAGESYPRYEKNMERDIERRVRQMQLDLGK